MAAEGTPRYSPLQPAYLAGSQGRRLLRFNAPNVGPNAAMGTIETIRRRNRQAARNDAWFAAGTEKWVCNMVGTGIQAMSVNGTEAEQEAVKELWEEFMQRCDADGVVDGYGLQALMVREWEEAGEAFVRLRSRRPTDPLPVPLQIQCLESEQCPSSYFATSPSGNPIRAGIEFSPIGERVAYWFYKTHPNDAQFSSTFANSDMTRVPADEVLHLFEPLRFGQIRGVPRATPILTRLMNLDALSDAAVERAKICNLFGLIFKPPADAPDGDASIISDAERADVAVGAQPDMKLQPATGMEVPPGWEVDTMEPPALGQDFFNIVRYELMAIAAARGVPYEVLTGDLKDVSDRSLRLILNDFRRLIEHRQWLYLIPQFLQPLREAFYDAAVLAGKLDAPGYATKRRQYVKTLWVPQGFPYSHPVQDVDADIKAIGAGLKSKRSTILGNGDDPRQVHKEIVADNAEADADEVTYTSDGRVQKAAKVAQPQPTPTDDAENNPSQDPNK